MKKDKSTEENGNKDILANFKAEQEFRVKEMDKMKHDLAKFGEESDKEEEVDYDEDEENFVCKICGKEFDDRNKLSDHVAEHY